MVRTGPNWKRTCISSGSAQFQPEHRKSSVETILERHEVFTTFPFCSFTFLCYQGDSHYGIFRREANKSCNPYTTSALYHYLSSVTNILINAASDIKHGKPSSWLGPNSPLYCPARLAPWFQ